MKKTIIKLLFFLVTKILKIFLKMAQFAIFSSKMQALQWSRQAMDT